MIKGIVFDKDGTLLEYKDFWMPVSESAINSILNKYGIKNDFTDALMQTLNADDEISGVFYFGTYGDYADAFNKTFCENGYDVSVSHSEVSAAFSESLSAGKLIPTCENIKEVFLKLKKCGIKTAVVTTDNPTITERCLKELGIYEYIDCIYADDGVNPTKPNPYYMNCFCEKFGLNKSDVIMVGDTVLDIEFAQNSGVISVGVSKNPLHRKIFSEKADFNLHDISHIFEVIENV